MFCKNCGSQLDEDARFCTKCGNKVENDLNAKFCVHCGSKLDDDSVFCTKCGSRVKDEINVSDEEKTMPESNDSAESVEVELIPCETNQQEKNEQELVVSQSIEQAWQESLEIPEGQKASDAPIIKNESNKDKRIEQLENQCAELKVRLEKQQKENELQKKQDEQKLVGVAKYMDKRKRVFIVLSIVFFITTVIGFGLAIWNYNI